MSFIFDDVQDTHGKVVENPIFGTRSEGDLQVRAGRAYFTIEEGQARISTDKDRKAKNIQGEVFFFPVGEVYYKRNEGKTSLGNISARVARGKTPGPNNRTVWGVGSWLAFVPVTMGGQTIYTAHFGLVGEETTKAPNGNLSLSVQPPQNAKDLDLAVTGHVQNIISEMLGHAPEGCTITRIMDDTQMLVPAVQRYGKKTSEYAIWSSFRDTIVGEGEQIQVQSRLRAERGGKEFKRRERGSKEQTGSNSNVTQEEVDKTLSSLDALGGV